MTKPRTYATPLAFSRAIEDRIRQRAKLLRRPHNGVRQRILFEHTLERLAHHVDVGTWVLKGGLALEFRLDEARTTRDIDLSIVGSVDAAIKNVRGALAPAFRTGSPRTGDRLATGYPNKFLDLMVVGERALQPLKDYSGARLDIQARIGGDDYGTKFHIDIAAGDIFCEPPEPITKPSFFQFMGAPDVAYRVYPVSTHLAEKVHAITLPRDRENSRLKDLVDIALLLNLAVDHQSLATSLKATFEHRGTHSLPKGLPNLPHSWTSRYPRERARTFPWLPWPSLAELEAVVRARLDPILARLTSQA